MLGAWPCRGVAVAAPHAATTERVVVDRHTGLAHLRDRSGRLFHRRQAGRRAARTSNIAYAGAVWRFGNEGNRAAFAADPEVYMPRFGGYDPVGISRGVATPGYPGALGRARRAALSLLYGRARAAFIADPAAVIAGPRRAGPTVKSELAE